MGPLPPPERQHPEQIAAAGDEIAEKGVFVSYAQWVLIEARRRRVMMSR